MKIVAVLLLAGTALLAQKPLTNEDVIDMAHKGMSNDSIQLALSRNVVKLDISAAGVTGLHAAGLDGQLIDTMIMAGSRPQPAPSFGVIGAGIPLTGRTAHEVRVSGWIQSDKVLNGYAGLWVRVDGKDNKTVALDNSLQRYAGDQHDEPSVRGATGTTGWTEYHVDLPIADGASRIAFGALMPGNGTAWFDALKVELDGVPYTDPKRDYDFESADLKGFGPNGTGYTITLDNTTAYTGQQSVKMTYTGVTPTKLTTSPLTNADILLMTRGGVLTRNIITEIRNLPVHFDTSMPALQDLTSSGVDPMVVRLVQESSGAKVSSAFGVATGTFPVAVAAGHTIRFSVWIKTEKVEEGYAGPWWRVDGKNKGQLLAFDNSLTRMIDGEKAAGDGALRGARGTTDWTLYRFELPVGAEAKNINFGVMLTGTGAAWADTMSVEIDGVPYNDPKLFDFDFESASVRGFYVGGPGYAGGVDDKVAYRGSQSLKLQFIGYSGNSQSAASGQ